ncbi:hypothetical protein [Andreprevotia sp. IGB-42]|uniref:hypothetical protein n=1 Tax=Andreprevotia sp. IGB-42 TaxID=2497473 RepID=UPI001F47E05F|nr:hypothetical protein [Andreprevotia sp. IGB-42]
MLKVVGADVVSLGRFKPDVGDEVFADEDVATHRYRKLLISKGYCAGGILIGWPVLNDALGRMVKGRRPVSADQLGRLRAGDWSTLL